MSLADRIREEFEGVTTEEERQQLYEKLKEEGVNKGYIDRVLKRRSRSETGTGGTRSGRTAPVVRREVDGFLIMSPKDMVPPERALREFRLQDGDYRHGFLDGIEMMLLAARYNQILAASQAEIVRGQLEIYEKSRGSAAEIARQAAAEASEKVASNVVSWLTREKPWVTASPDPFKAMIADVMRPLLDNIVSAFTPKQTGEATGTTPPGFTEE